MILPHDIVILLLRQKLPPRLHLAHLLNHVALLVAAVNIYDVGRSANLEHLDRLLNVPLDLLVAKVLAVAPEVQAVVEGEGDGVVVSAYHLLEALFHKRHHLW